MPRDIPTPKGRPPLLPIYDDMKEAARARTPVETHQEAIGIASGLPGDRHGRLSDPEPFRGRNLSKNPHPKISPQTMPATIERSYQSPESLTYSSQTRENKHSESLRKLTKR